MRSSREKKTASRTPTGETLNELVLQIFKTHTALSAVAPTVIQDDRINSLKWQLMGLIRHGGKTAAQLGRELGLTRQVTMWHAQALAGEQLVSFESNPDHQRAHLVTLTPEGEQVLEQLTANQTAWINRLAKKFDHAQLAAALDTLRAFTEELR